MSTRNPDGRFRNHNNPLVLSAEMLRSHWLEGEVLRLKRLGFSYEAIAQQITEVGRGQKAPLTPLPESVTFPPDYKVTAMGCHKALSRALKRAPTLEADEMRRLDTDRCEDMFLSLTPSMRQGDPQAVRAAVQVLALKAGINGYKSPEMEVTVSPGPSWSSALSKDQTVSLFKGAMTLLIEGGIKIDRDDARRRLGSSCYQGKGDQDRGGGQQMIGLKRSLRGLAVPRLRSPAPRFRRIPGAVSYSV
jgi:hypothetical protein